MSSIRTPPQKKQLAYERDHYNRNGQSNKAWRKLKPRKKARARRAFRKASKDPLRVAGTEPDTTSKSVVRKQNSIRQKRVDDWGAIHLREFVETVRVRNRLNVGAKKGAARSKELKTRSS